MTNKEPEVLFETDRVRIAKTPHGTIGVYLQIAPDVWDYHGALATTGLLLLTALRERDARIETLEGAAREYLEAHDHFSELWDGLCSFTVPKEDDLSPQKQRCREADAALRAAVAPSEHTESEGPSMVEVPYNKDAPLFTDRMRRDYAPSSNPQQADKAEEGE